MNTSSQRHLSPGRGRRRRSPKPAARRVWVEVLKPVAAQLQTGATQLAERMVDRLQSELPSILPDASAVAEQLASVEAILRQIAQLIETGDDPRRVDLAPATAAIGRSGAQRDIPLIHYIRSVRVGHEYLWQWMCERLTATAGTADQVKALELATNWLFAYIDNMVTNAERVYEIEREAWLGGAAAARASAVDDILTEREDDAQRASKRLRYDINRHHLGVRIWLGTVRDNPDPQATLTQVLAQLARVASAQSSLVHPAGSGAIAGWVSRPQALTAAELEAANTSGNACLPEGVRVAFGEPGWGISGFRRSHIEASHAHRFASLLGDDAPVVTCYRQVAVAALASTDGEHAVAFVKRILGPLAANDEATDRIAVTLAVYLEENRSPAKAAQRLMVHPNTVSYRIHQAEELLGRPIDANIRDLSVALALRPAVRGLTHRSTAKL
jgi:PucR C-terminal helix-turn-helix domain/GGDEF-like domain